MRPLLAALALLASTAGHAGAEASCREPPTPVPCEHCFAVLVVPDTQSYTRRRFQPQGAAHLDLVMRYACRHRTRWIEPRTGKTMPIAMLIQLGDLVHRGDPGDSEAARRAEWVRVDAAFDRLDACEPPVPYLVTLGNHDLDAGDYRATSDGYDRYFGEARWREQGVACTDPARCDVDAGRYFIGGGDPIRAGSRGRLGAGVPGPPRDLPGRHRAGVIRTPDGGRMLFLGLELAFDLGPPAAADDARWPLRVLADHAGVPTLVFHHSLLWTFGAGDPRPRFGPETWGADGLAEGDGERGGMRALWERIVAPHPQITMVWSGHVLKPASQADFLLSRDAGPPVPGFLRNFQSQGVPGEEGPGYGAGWNVMAAFDPTAGEVRVRSLRIDVAGDGPSREARHTAPPAPTHCLDLDAQGVGERVLPWPARVPPGVPPGAGGG